MKERAVALIIHGEHVLLLHRRKEGREYYALPGGKLEAGESPENACIREAKEETGLTITLERKLATLQNLGRTEHYYLAATHEGIVHLGGPEKERNSPENYYAIAWVHVDRLEEINLLPSETRPICIACVRERATL